MIGAASITLTDVSDGLSMGLSSYSAVVTTEADGSGGDYSGCLTEISVKLGTIDLTSEYTFAVKLNGLAGVLSGNVLMITNVVNESGYAILTATHPTYGVLTAKYSVAKVKKGGHAYVVSVVSDSGNYFKPGQTSYLTLRAIVFCDGKDVTDELQPSSFRWTRKSVIDRAYPNDDASWNTAHVAGYKQVSITAEDVYAKATFNCSIYI